MLLCILHLDMTFFKWRGGATKIEVKFFLVLTKLRRRIQNWPGVFFFGGGAICFEFFGRGDFFLGGGGPLPHFFLVQIF